MKEKYLLLGLVLMAILTRVFFLADFQVNYFRIDVICKIIFWLLMITQDFWRY